MNLREEAIKAVMAVAEQDARIYGIGFTWHHPDGSVTYLPYDQVHIHGNAIHYKPKE